MKAVSNKFKEAVSAPVRKTTAEVEFEIVNLEAYEDAEVSVKSEAPISRRRQVIDKKRRMTNKYGTYERNYFNLDGSCYIPPNQTENIDSHLGWWNNNLCDYTGYFSSKPYISVSLDKVHDLAGVTISFDTNTDEYATSIEVYFINENGIIEYNFFEPSSSTFILEQAVSDVEHIEIYIYSWSEPYRRAKISAVDLGIVKEYTDNELIKINVIDELSTTSETLPASELTFTVDNSSRDFNILNPSGFYEYLQERQGVNLKLGVETYPGIFEYVNYGRFYLKEWKSDEGALTASFTARNVIDVLDDYEMENLTAKSTNLGEIVEEIMQVANIKKCEIDGNLYNTSTQGIYKKMTCRQLLQNVCIAGRAVAYTNGDGVLVLKVNMSNTVVDDIVFDNVYKEPKVNLDNLVKVIEVAIYNNGEIVDTYEAINPGIDNGKALRVENTLINNSTIAAWVAFWLLGEYNSRAIYEINWRQNPALDIGDMVQVENSYGTNNHSRIIKQELEYAGYLAGKTTTKGGI